MSVASLNRLGNLIQLEREALLEDWKLRVLQLPSAKELDAPTLVDHIPTLLDEIAEALQSRDDESIPQHLVDGTPPHHGRQRLRDGFNIEEVVAEYNILRGSIHDLAERNGVVIRGTNFHILNRVLDEAIGLAVQTFATERALEVQQRRDEHLAFVAHDLRTPLNAISLSTQLLTLTLGEAANEPDTAQALTTLQRNVRRLDDLVKKVLDDHLAQPGQPTKIVRRQIDLWPVVQSVFYDLKPIADTNSTELSNEVPIDLVACADASLLSRIVQNLVANAVRYTPRGRVTVRARTVGTNGDVECLVVDNGKGISPDMLGRVFEKFESDADREETAGLGSTIVKELVEAHGGKVLVESEQDEQTTFRFLLPGVNTTARRE